MSRRISQLAAYGLIALVGVAGLGGESLHYIWENAFEKQLLTGVGGNASSDDQSVKTAVVAHRHGPDLHWHTHVVQDDAVRDESRDADSPDSLITDSEWRLHDHSCAWLSIVSLLELGKAASVIIGTVDSAQASRIDVFAAHVPSVFSAWTSARGPPLSAS